MLSSRPNQSMKLYAVPELPSPDCACTQSGKFVAFPAEEYAYDAKGDNSGGVLQTSQVTFY